MNPVYLGLEVGATLFFVGAALAALRRGRLPFLELVSAAAFGILLEGATSSPLGGLRTSRGVPACTNSPAR